MISVLPVQIYILQFYFDAQFYIASLAEKYLQTRLFIITI